MTDLISNRKVPVSNGPLLPIRNLSWTTHDRDGDPARMRTGHEQYDPNPPYRVNTPAHNTMNAAINKYYPGLEDNANIWSGSWPLAWPSGLLLEDAVKARGLGATGTPSAAEIVTGLESLKGDTLEGLLPPLTFAPGKPHSVDCWFTSQVLNGQPQLLDNGKLTCGSTPSS
jgi:branched-chain amino acid transport system substrate-binding protein